MIIYIIYLMLNFPFYIILFQIFKDNILLTNFNNNNNNKIILIILFKIFLTILK